MPELRGRALLAISAAPFRSLLIYALLAAPAASLAINHITDAAFIVAVLLVIATVGTVQEWRAHVGCARSRSLSRTS